MTGSTMINKSCLTAFPPIIGVNPNILVLGTMPGAISLAEAQYYAHPRNQFWRLMGDIYGFDAGLPYADRLEKLKKAKVALWDVLHECERNGSLDSAIKNARANDFDTFFKAHPSIHTVIFTGKTAETLFKRHAKILMNGSGLTFKTVPSPSPAHAARSYAEKLILWKQAFSI